MKTSELLKKLKSAGFVFQRHGSNHDIYVNPNTGVIIAVPRHAREIPTGTALKILKDGGLR